MLLNRRRILDFHQGNTSWWAHQHLSTSANVIETIHAAIQIALSVR